MINGRGVAGKSSTVREGPMWECARLMDQGHSAGGGHHWHIGTAPWPAKERREGKTACHRELPSSMHTERSTESFARSTTGSDSITCISARGDGSCGVQKCVDSVAGLGLPVSGLRQDASEAVCPRPPAPQPGKTVPSSETTARQPSGQAITDRAEIE